MEASTSKGAFNPDNTTRKSNKMQREENRQKKNKSEFKEAKDNRRVHFTHPYKHQDLTGATNKDNPDETLKVKTNTGQNQNSPTSVAPLVDWCSAPLLNEILPGVEIIETPPKEKTSEITNGMLLTQLKELTHQLRFIAPYVRNFDTVNIVTNLDFVTATQLPNLHRELQRIRHEVEISENKDREIQSLKERLRKSDDTLNRERDRFALDLEKEKFKFSCLKEAMALCNGRTFNNPHIPQS